MKPCECIIILRTGETLDSSHGDRPCKEVSRIILCGLHYAAPALLEAVVEARLALEELAKHPALGGDEPEFNEGGPGYEALRVLRAAEDAAAKT